MIRALKATQGASGLYTRSLFHFGPQPLDEIGPAIELGRSFVRPEYQRESNGLLWLWKGIGHFVAMNQRYRRLFGRTSCDASISGLSVDCRSCYGSF
jgi:putative hemolysin